ncbi:hypothetical protein M413DRAFT_22972 [Hebeloma cylindrosporum]|uniref:Uncharacterized protein n=1 Tax=Hebeloma cylindrosporum TaxID=76867 RepID=A0A0C3CWG0_HEBCY|nr:hypothetical protein M413DRAFT_22972 [Hebeloma cylindrosporum h7]
METAVGNSIQVSPSTQRITRIFRLSYFLLLPSPASLKRVCTKPQLKTLSFHSRQILSRTRSALVRSQSTTPPYAKALNMRSTFLNPPKSSNENWQQCHAPQAQPTGTDDPIRLAPIERKPSESVFEKDVCAAGCLETEFQGPSCTMYAGIYRSCARLTNGEDSHGTRGSNFDFFSSYTSELLRELFTDEEPETHS